MNKVLTIILLILLCGCEGRISKNDEPAPVEYVTKLIKLGYSQKEAEIADSFNDNLKEKLLNNYDEGISLLLKNVKVNEKIIGYYIDNNVDANIINRLLEDKYFIYDNLNLYLANANNFNNIRSLVEYINSKAYKKGYEEYVDSDTSKGIYTIASKIYYLGDFVPNNLVDVEKDYYILSQPQLQKEAWDAYKQMADAARNENLYYYISTAYRSYDFQNTLYNNYLKKDSQENVDTYSSRPGFSDHQIGLSCDIRTKEKSFNDFTETKEAEWLKDNAYKYGFIMRYPKEKENITGYTYESWHFRYVGKDAAKEIYENNITFDEYYSFYVEKTN